MLKSSPKSKLLLGLLLGLITVPPVADAEGPPVLWGDLQPGPYAIGFETIEKYDYSRTFRDKYDYDGNERSGQTSRPIQICVWYPASAQDGDLTMGYAEYAFPTPVDGGFYGVLAQLQGREIGFIAGQIGPGAMLANLMNMTVGCVRDATPAEGTFPLVIYCPQQSAGLSENATLCEYLASHGFVVATSHAMGQTTINVEANAADLESIVRDREFVYANMLGDPRVDPAKPAVIGYSLGGTAALLMQMRNTDIEAVVALNPAYLYQDGSSLAASNPFFDIARTDVPMLQAFIEGHEDLDTAVISSLRFARRYNLAIKEADGIDFSQYAVIRAMLADTTAGSNERALATYGLLCRHVLEFLKYSILGDASSRKFLEQRLAPTGAESPEYVLEVLDEENPPPTQAQFMSLIEDGRILRAVEIYGQMKQTNPDYVPFQEVALNNLGYQLLQQNRIEEAVAVFKINAEAYPHSANTWDSYADGCMAAGDTETAIKCYETVLRVLPADTLATPQIRELLQNNATTNLEALKN